MSNRTVFESLQVFRGIAAIAVVLHHGALSTDAFVGAVPSLSRYLQIGYLGVDFFFVLSGFIICHAHADDPTEAGAARAYIVKRLIRVFPGYLPIALVLMLAYPLLPGLSASGGREYSVASSLFLVPADAPPVLSVAWTLVHEMVFYTIFLANFFARRVFPLLMAVWASANFLALLGYAPQGWMSYLMSPLNLEFIFGMLAATAFKRGTGQHLSPQTVAGAGLLTALAGVWMIGADAGDACRVIFGLGMALLVLGAVRLDLRRSGRSSEWMLLLGSASYAIYLVHNPLLSLTQRVLARLAIGWLPSCVIGVAIALLFGFVYFHFVETPALRWIRRQPTVVRLGRASSPGSQQA